MPNVLYQKELFIRVHGLSRTKTSLFWVHLGLEKTYKNLVPGRPDLDA